MNYSDRHVKLHGAVDFGKSCASGGQPSAPSLISLQSGCCGNPQALPLAGAANVADKTVVVVATGGNVSMADYIRHTAES